MTRFVLSFKHDQEDFHLPKHSASILAKEVPRIVIDWSAGNERISKERLEVENMGIPEVIMKEFDNRHGNTAKVTVYFPEIMEDRGIEFWLDVAEPIRIVESDKAEKNGVRYAASRIAELLGYDLHEYDDEDSQ